MKIVGVLLIIAGIVGLVLVATLFPYVGIPSIPADIGLIIAGIGFLLLCCKDPCDD